eukprot:CAMPEP_0117014408 /NCGR_PEP_ID=MMETSP0472-20121206/11692_1 /TAXON_ID=693140 ORGANISM="Tiarina fusus, Strain LIS" /NCGR_SAMPLE_ID=MMETSP0472 /ASSEMBLY_ACC=CAM_ASM_000603 /LENGTH=973 /DNA_ID=CAMNT_0004717955 /DNA_START=61 /DNA_END=2982 /DNA_ORIENTATION=+
MKSTGGSCCIPNGVAALGLTVVLLVGFLLNGGNAFTLSPGGGGVLQQHRMTTMKSPLRSTTEDIDALVADVVETAISTSSDAELDSIQNYKGSQWEVHKFGGASLATAELYRTVGDLLIKEAAGRGEGAIPTMAIVSARGGMTDLLVKVVDTALVDFEEANNALDEAVEGQISLLKELATPEITDSIEANFRKDAKDIRRVVQSLRMLRTVPAVTMEVVTGYGEIWSAQTLNAYLKTTGVPCDWVDARDILIVKSDSTGLGEKGGASTGGVRPLWTQTSARLKTWWNTDGRSKGFLDLDYEKTVPILVATGFVATTAEGVPTTLKRSGSDYSATIFARLMAAGRVTMWKNTDGVYTADPRRVPEAFSIASLKYDEALELAYFGAQVLHPSAMVPCIDDGIPVYVRNIFNPAFEGTVIQGRSPTLAEARDSQGKHWRAQKGEIPIKGITSVDKCSLVTLEGASVIGGASVAERFMGAMAKAGINVLIITQASSESSVTVVVPENEGETALQALRDAFELELSRSTIGSLSLDTGVSIVAIVGEGMAMNSGVSATFMSSLSKASVNIRLIAQGSSERQIAVVVDGDDCSRALRAVHMGFTLSETTASVAILGSTGSIGSALCNQLESQRDRLIKELGVDMRVSIAACSSKMLVDAQGLDIADEYCDPDMMDEKGEDLDLDLITSEVQADVNPLRVIIDCTDSAKVAEYYEKWLGAGIHVISPSRQVAAGPIERYKRACQLQKENSVYWQYESSVGSALPILTTLQDLHDTGDKISVIRGSVSGTLAYVLSNLSETKSFSEAMMEAVDLGYSETDFRQDLSGDDTVRKVVILARELGMDISIEDVEVESLIPQEMIDKEYTGSKEEKAAQMLEDVKSIDASMLERFKAAEASDRALRYKFVINEETGKCKCGLQEVDRTDTLYRLKANENLVAFETERYQTSPLIVKGAAAGAELAAAGMFADLLRVTRAYQSQQN